MVRLQLCYSVLSLYWWMWVRPTFIVLRRFIPVVLIQCSLKYNIQSNNLYLPNKTGNAFRQISSHKLSSWSRKKKIKTRCSLLHGKFDISSNLSSNTRTEFSAMNGILVSSNSWRQQKSCCKDSLRCSANRDIIFAQSGIFPASSQKQWQCLATLLCHFKFISLLLFFCGAAAQRGPWPPHSWGFWSHTTTQHSR